MIKIVEQAKQSPRNSTPVGWDADTLCFPKVNTCLTISTVGKDGGKLVGLHLGLFMGAGEEGGKGSENSTMIDEAHLEMYLHVQEQQAWVRGNGASDIYVAGAVEVWQCSAPTLYSLIERTVDVWATKMGATLHKPFKQFDDGKTGSTTVDVYVTRQGVRFTKPDSDTAVSVV